MTVTVEEFIAEAMTAVTDHDPYVYGGISLTSGCDCSGLIYASREKLGLDPGPRTSQEMWDTWQHIGVPAAQRGDLPCFRVNSDGGQPPQHIGINLGGGQFLEEPHTGLDAMVTAIPNTPSEALIGFLRMPDVVAGAAPTGGGTSGPVPPVPTTNLEDSMQMYAEDPKTGGGWGTDENGDNYPFGGAPLIPGLNDHPSYHAGAEESIDSNPCVGIAYWAFGLNDGILLFTKPSNGQGTWGGVVEPGQCPYDIYRFLRDGTPA